MKTVILKSFETGKYRKVRADNFKGKIRDKISYFNGLIVDDCKVIKIIDRVKKVKGVVYSGFTGMPYNWKAPKHLTAFDPLNQIRKPEGLISKGTMDSLRRGIEKYKRKILAEKRNKEELAKLRKRPYFLTRVDYIKGNPGKKENLKKIEFPCFCEFDANKGIHGSETCGQGVRGTGEINKTFTNDQVEYQLSRIGYQQKGLSVICSTPSLKRLFEIYDIEILKGEIQLWKEIQK